MENPVELRMSHGGYVIHQQITLAQSHAIQALLRGEAVAVPREITFEMSSEWVAAYANSTAGSGGGARREAYRAMLAASPFAKEGGEE